MINKATERVQREGAVVRWIMIAATAVAGIAGSPGHAAAQTTIVQNGGFEAPSISGNSQTLSATDSSQFLWTIGGTISLVRNFWQPEEGAQSIDLNGSGAGSITQPLPLAVQGNYYKIRFYYSNHPSLGSNPAQMTMRWGPSGSPSYFEQFTANFASTKSNMNWQFVERILPATAATTVLSFTSDTPANQNYGVAMDGVSVIPLAQQATLSVTVSPSPLVYGTTGTATTSGGSGTGAVTFSATGSTGCTVDAGTGVVTVTNASGTCVLTATKAHDNDYNPATSAPFTVQLALASQAALSVTVSPSTLVYPTTGTASASGGSGTGAVTYSAGASTGCAVDASTGTVSVVNASGTCGITATKAGDNHYNQTSASVTVALQKANQQTLSITGPTSLAYDVPATITVSGGSGDGTLSFSAGASTGCTVTGSTVTVIDAGNTSCTLVATKLGNNNYNDATSAPFAVTLPSPFAAPVLIRAVATAGNGVYIIGRIDGAAGIASTLQVYSASGCSKSQLVGGGTAVGSPLTVTPDAYGFFGTQITSGVTPGTFVAIQVTAPDRTAMSACLASSADNETWPKALQLSGTTTLTASDYLDTPGKVRWYKFDVLPGQRITVSLSNLPADYDLAVFKDIGATFLKLLGVGGTSDLTRVSAEYPTSVYAPGAFAPGAFAPGAFAPGAFAPGAFAPGAFAPGAFAPGAFAPGAFAPGAFAPGAFAPGAFAPGAFAPGAFAPGAFAPGAFAPGAFAPAGVDFDNISKAFSSAQTRSVVGVSATSGVGDELVVANSWNNIGSFYVRVVGRGGAYSTEGQFRVDITKGDSSCRYVTDTTLTPRDPATATGLATVILTDTSSAALAGDKTALLSKLALLAARPEVAGIIVDVAGDTRVGQLKAQAAANTDCPFAMNLVAGEIKGIVDSYRKNNPGLRYVVIAGNDDAIPFFRYPDQSLLGEESEYVPPVSSGSPSDASLRLDYVLSQDAYGAGTRISLRISDYPVPGLAVGRLVETPAEIAGMIDAYVATGGVVAPRSSMVSGYDFLADAAHAVSSELGQGTGVGVDELINEPNISPLDSRAWTAVDLATKLFSGRHDVIFLAGHFSANSALAADFSSNVLTTDLYASTTNFVNSIVFSAGCHSGYNLVDAAAIPGVTLPLDWAQAFAQKKATLIAGTGYQYGDTDFIEYSERLYRNFARQLRAGNGVVRVGEALVKAKIDYLAATPDIRGIHEKALLESTLFGLPMLGVNMPSGRGDIPGPGPGITPTLVGAASLGLEAYDLTINPDLTPHSVNLTSLDSSSNTVTASYLSGPDGVVSNPIEPVLPLVVRNATATDSTLVLRGVGFRGGSYSDSTVTPLSGAATTEIRGVHMAFGSPLFYPMRPWSINYYGALAGTGATSLLVTPAQHRAADIAQSTSTRRQYSQMNLRTYYSGNLAQAALADAPSIVSVVALPSGSGVDFTAQIVGDPYASIYEAWITWTNGPGTDGTGTWAPINLAQCGTPAGTAVCGTIQDTSIWKAHLDSLPTNLQYVIQAATGYGLVTLDDNRGLYYRLGGADQATTSLTFPGVQPPLPLGDGTTANPPATAKFGDDVKVYVTLASPTSGPLAGKSVTVGVGGAARVGTTDANGQAAIMLPVATVPGDYKIVASFAGDTNLLASATSAGIHVDPAITLFSPPVTSGVGVTLAVRLGDTVYPLLHESVRFTLTNSSGAVVKTIWVITDFLGQALLPPTGLDPGAYTLASDFAGNATYQPVSTTQSLTIAAQTINFGGAGLPDTLAYGSPPVVFTVSSGSGMPVTVALSPNPSPACTLSYDGTNYTLTAASPGTCTLVASADGTTTFTDVTVTQNIAIIKADQTIVFAALADRTFGDPPFPVSASGGASGNLVTFSSQTSGVCTVSGNLVTLVTAGTCTIAADQAGNGNYNAAAQVTQSFTVKKVAQTITFGAPANRTYGDAPFAVNATASSGLAVTFSVPAAAAAVCTVSGNTVTIIGAGNCTIAADQAGNGNYNPAPQIAQTFTVAKSGQTIAFGALAGKTVGDAAFAVGATASSGLAVTFSSLTTSVCTVSSSTVTIVAAGTCTIAADQAGNGNYNAAPQVTQSFTVKKVTQTITFGPLANKTYGDAPFTVSATASSGLAVTFSSQTTAVCTVSGTNGSNVAIVAVGQCTIAADQSGNGTYSAATQVPQTFTVAKATLTVMASVTPSALVYGDSDPSYTASWSDPANCASTPVTVTFSGKPSASPAPAGAYTITPAVTSVVSSSCNVTAKPTTLTVNNATPVFSAIASSFVYPAGTAMALLSGKLARTVTPTSWVFPANPLSIALQGPVTRSYTPTAGSPDGPFSVTDNTIPIGSYNVTFTYAGGTNFNAAAPATSALRIEGFTATGSMLQARKDHTATLLNDGRVLVVGGFDASGSPTATSEVYCPAASAVCPAAAVGKFTATGNLPSKSAGHTATLLGNGKVYQAGGGNSSAAIYDPATGLWTSAGGITVRSYHTATLLPNGKVLLAGGVDNSGKTLQSTVIYDPTTGTNVNGPTMLYARERHTASLLTMGPNAGKVLLAGGRQKSGSGYAVLSSAELYDPTTNTIVAAPSMTAGRFSHARATLSVDGRVVVAGGSGDAGSTPSSSLNSVEIYGPPATGTTWTWTVLAPGNALQQPSGRREHTMTRLADGRLLAAGGVNSTSNRLATSELFSPDQFTLGAAMVAARSGHTSTLLQDGRVLVVGGAGGTTGTALNTAELYNGPAGP